MQYYAPIRRYCRGQLPSMEEAEDAAQSTFLRAFTALQQGVVPQHESAWLYKIAHNVCLSRRLSATRRARVETPRDLSLIQDEVGGPVHSHDELIGLDDVLADMPERLRTAFLMREWQGLSYHEIADELGISHSAVETLIFRARRHLAKALESGGERVKSARRALDFGWLVAGAKALFGGGAAIKAGAAVAAAAVAVGGVAGGRALAKSGGQPEPSRAQQLFADVLAAPPVVDRVTPVASAAQVQPTTVLAADGTPSAASEAAPIAGVVSAPTAASSPAVPVTGVAGAATPLTPTSSPSPVVTPASGGTSAPEPAAASPLPAVSPPPVTPPAVSPPPAPSVAPPVAVAPVPTVQTPTVETPTVSVPTVPVPTVPVPTVQTPTVQTPTVQTPTVQTPTVQTPTVPTPTVQTPTVPEAPAAQAPQVPVSPPTLPSAPKLP